MILKPLFGLGLSIRNSIVSSKIYYKRDDFNFEVVFSHFLMEQSLAHFAMVHTFYTFVCVS